MDSRFNPVNIEQALVEKRYPTVVMWNRLEGRPRTHHFDTALKAEVRDALWMLTKQWQMGEFKADDAGSPVLAKVHISTSHLNKYQAADQPEQNFEGHIPLEVKAEQKKIPFTRDGKDISVDIRLQMGRYWVKLLKKEGLDFRVAYTSQYPFLLPENTRANDYIYAHQEIWQQYAAISGRCMDGYKMYQHLRSSGNKASDGIPAVDPEKSRLDELGRLFVAWYERLYYQPSDEKNNGWLPDRLEYQFQCAAISATEVKTLKAAEYYQGHLDWFAFDVQESSSNSLEPAKKTFTDTFIPAHVKFDGMPDTRWWKFEDGKTNMGDVKPATTDLSKLLLMEFALVFANDWFIIPYTLPVGSLANIEGLTVKNNFGETFWIKATEEERAADLPWSMFKLRAAEQNNTLLLAPAALKVQEGKPLEEIRLIRDEMSNMVWGIETVVPGPMGKGDKGSEAALRIRQFHERIVKAGIPATAEMPYAARISYLAMTDVPENWIPFVPVHIKNSLPHDTREIQLQRASMLRIIAGDPAAPVKIKPQTSILRAGLENLDGEGKPNPLAYFIHEEEVPRSGIRVQQSFQRTRWTNGEVFVWLGMQKKIGRGEGSSGLAFDQLAYNE